MRFGITAAIVALATAGFLPQVRGDEIGQAAWEREWVGLHRDEVVAKLGEPSKARIRKGLETLIYRELIACGAVDSTHGPILITQDPADSTLPPGEPMLKAFEHASGGTSSGIRWSKTKLIFQLDSSHRVERVRFLTPKRDRRCFKSDR